MSYNGWANWETWNVALWIGNDEGFYRLALECENGYSDFQRMMAECGSTGTPDGAGWEDYRLDLAELEIMLAELAS